MAKRRAHQGRRKNPDGTLLWVLAGAAVLGVGYLLYKQGQQTAQLTAQQASASGAAAGSSSGGGSSLAGDVGSLLGGLVGGMNQDNSQQQPPPGS